MRAGSRRRLTAALLLAGAAETELPAALAWLGKRGWGRAASKLPFDVAIIALEATRKAGGTASTSRAPAVHQAAAWLQ